MQKMLILNPKFGPYLMALQEQHKAPSDTFKGVFHEVRAHGRGEDAELLCTLKSVSKWMTSQKLDTRRGVKKP